MADHITTLKDDPVASAIFAQLSRDGVARRDLDAGYLSFHAPGQRRVVGRGNGEIEPQEVYDYVFSHYEKYQGLFRRASGFDLPWMLPPEKEASPKVREFVQWIRQVIGAVKRELRASGFDEKDPSYSAILSWALYMGFLEAKPKEGTFAEDVFKRMEAAVKRVHAAPAAEKPECRKGMTLAGGIEEGCRNGEKAFVLYQALRLAGFKAMIDRGTFVREGASSPRFLPVIVNDRSEIIFPELADPKMPVMSTLTSPRIMAGVWYAIGADSFGQAWPDERLQLIKGALALIPEFESSHYLYGRWLAYSEKRDLPGAEGALRTALSIEPEFHQARLDLGDVLSRQNRPQEAAAEFRRVVQSDAPRETLAMAFRGLGNALAKLGKDDEASAAFKKGLDLKPESPWIMKDVAVLQCKKEPTDSCRKALEAAAKLLPNDTDLLRGLAWVYDSSEEFGKAEAAWEKAVALDPADAQSYANLARRFLEKKEPAKADRMLEEALKRNPKDVVVRYVQALVLQSRDDPGGAVKILETLVSEGGDHVQTHVLAGFCYLRLGENQKALSFFEKAVSLDPQSADARYGFAVALFAIGDARRAVEAFGAVDVRRLSSERSVPSFHDQYGRVLASAKRYREAEEQFRTAIALDRTHLSALFRLANLYLFTGRAAKAVEVAEELKRQAPQSVETHLVLGNLCMMRRDRDLEGALRAFKQAHAIAPTEHLVALHLAMVHVNMKALDAAERLVDSITASATNRTALAYASWTKGEILGRRGSEEQALPFFEKAIQLRVDRPNPYGLAGHIYLKRGDLDRAERTLREAIALHSADDRESELESYHLYLLGVVFQKQGKGGEAVKYFDDAISRNPRYAAPYVNRGMIYHHFGNYDGALESFGRALALDADLPGALELMAVTLHTIGDHDRAIAQLKKAAKIAPKEPRIRFLLFSVSLAKGDVAAAEEMLNGLRASEPKGMWLARAEADMALHKRDDPAASRWLKEIIRVDQGGVTAGMAEIAVALLEGDRERAVVLARDMIARDPRGCQLHNLLGVALAEKGQKEEAAASFRRAVGICPGNEAAKENLNLLGEGKRLKLPLFPVPSSPIPFPARPLEGLKLFEWGPGFRIAPDLQLRK